MKLTQLAKKLEPFIRKLIREMLGDQFFGGGGLVTWIHGTAFPQKDYTGNRGQDAVDFQLLRDNDLQVARADRSVIVSGSYNRIDPEAENSVVGGIGAWAYKNPNSLHMGKMVTNFGDAQWGWYTERAEIAPTNYWQTIAEIFMREDTAYTFHVLLMGSESYAATQIYTYKIDGVIVNDGGTISLKYSNVDMFHSDDWVYEVRAFADNTNNSLIVQMRDFYYGLRNSLWIARVNTAEVSNVWDGVVWLDTAGISTEAQPIADVTGGKMIMKPASVSANGQSVYVRQTVFGIASVGLTAQPLSLAWTIGMSIATISTNAQTMTNPVPGIIKLGTATVSYSGQNVTRVRPTIANSAGITTVGQTILPTSVIPLNSATITTSGQSLEIKLNIYLSFTTLTASGQSLIVINANIQLNSATVTALGQSSLIFRSIVKLSATSIGASGQTMLPTVSVAMNTASINITEQPFVKINRSVMMNARNIWSVGQAIKVNQTIQMASASLSSIAQSIVDITGGNLLMYGATISTSGQDLLVVLTTLEMSVASVGVSGNSALINRTAKMTAATISTTGQVIKLGRVILSSVASVTASGQSLNIQREIIEMSLAAISATAQVVTVDAAVTGLLDSDDQSLTDSDGQTLTDSDG